MKLAWCHLPIFMICIAGCRWTDSVAPELVAIPTTRNTDETALSETVTGTIDGKLIETTTTFQRFHPDDRQRHNRCLEPMARPRSTFFRP